MMSIVDVREHDRGDDDDVDDGDDDDGDDGCDDDVDGHDAGVDWPR